MAKDVSPVSTPVVVFRVVVACVKAGAATPASATATVAADAAEASASRAAAAEASASQAVAVGRAAWWSVAAAATTPGGPPLGGPLPSPPGLPAGPLPPLQNSLAAKRQPWPSGVGRPPALDQPVPPR